MKRPLILILLILLPLAFAAAQDAAVDSSIMSIETGVVFAYNLNTNGYGPGVEFGINLTVTDFLQIGFSTIRGDGTNCLDYTLFKSNFFFIPKLGVNVVIGAANGTNLAAGAGIFWNAFQRGGDGQSISTVMRLKLDYLFTETLNDYGSIVAGIQAKIGY